MSGEATTPRVVVLSPHRRTELAHAALGFGTRAACAIALMGSTVVSLAIVLAAAERPSFLSGPAHHGFPGWMVGPLARRSPWLIADRVTLEARFVGALVILFVCWLVAMALAPRVRVAWIAATLVAIHVIYFLSPPLSLTDLFNYLHYGRTGANAGLNPYVALPIATRHDAAYMYSNWHHLPSPYGPLFTLVTYALALLPVPAAYWVWKVIVGLASLGCLAIVWWLARRLGRSPQRALAFAGLNPLVAVYGLGGAHNDALMMLGALGAVALVVAGREAAGGGASLAAVAVKVSTVPLVALIVLGARRRVRGLAGAAVAGVAVGVIVLAVFAGKLPAVGLQDRLATPLSIPSVLSVAAGLGGVTPGVRTITHVVLALAAAACCIAVARRRDVLIGACGALMLATVVTLAWAMPWYVGWILPFAALARSRWLAGACVVLTVWLALGAIPQMPKLVHSIGYYPTRSAVGRANHLYTEHLLK
jgi:Glycosyltransferase family 87